MNTQQSIMALNHGDGDCFVIPKWVFRLVGNDLITAMFLKQCIYLDNHFNNPQGFFQTYPQWLEESGLTRYQVDNALKTINKLAGRDVITTAVIYTGGANKKHYKVQWDALYEWFCEKQQNILNGLTNKSSQTDEVKPSSSPTLPAPRALPPVSAVQEEEKLESTVLNLEVDEGLIKAFAQLCKVRVTDPKLPHLIRQMQIEDQDLAPRDFRGFKMYYEVVRDKRDKYETPYPLFVLNGWSKFLSWWQAHDEDGVIGYLPGTDVQMNLPRWSWVGMEDWEVGEGVLDERWGKRTFYAKQADGTFAEAPESAWPDWATRESA